MDSLTVVQKILVNAYATLVLADRNPVIPDSLQEYVNIRVAERQIEILG